MGFVTLPLEAPRPAQEGNIRYTVIFAAALAVFLAFAATARAGMVEDCLQDRDPDLSISGSSTIALGYVTLLIG